MDKPKKRIVKSKLPPAGRYNTSGFFGGSSSLTIIKPAVLGRPAKPVEVEVPIKISEDADDGCDSLDEDLSLSPVRTKEAVVAARKLAQPPEAFAKWPRVENFTLVQFPSSRPGVLGFEWKAKCETCAPYQENCHYRVFKDTLQDHN
jgi:hypothetical protein